jgi:L-alanine-DL-glutamate epimerase-like enolase superfamily enzyme
MRITDVEAIVVSEPPERIARHSWDGSQDAIIIRISTDDGLIGLGEVDSSPEVIRGIIEAPPSMRTMWGLRDLCLDEDPRDIGRIWDKLYRGSSYYGRSGAAMQAISGVEVALWDILGKATSLPVSTLLGGARRSTVRVYASLMTPETPEATTEAVRALVAAGFTAIKLGGGPLGRDPAEDEAIVRAAREADAAVELMIDMGQCWDTAEHALSVAHRLAPYGLRWMEEPLWPDELAPYVWLTERSPVPIAAGEAETTESRLREMVERRAVHILQPDITRVGGLQSCQRVVAMARAAALEVVLHCYNTGITKAASLHLSAAAPNLPLLEYCVETNPIQTSVTHQQFPVVNGRVAVPTDPGLGVDLDQDTIRQYRTEREATPRPAAKERT